MNDTKKEYIRALSVTSKPVSIRYHHIRYHRNSRRDVTSQFSLVAIFGCKFTNGNRFCTDSLNGLIVYQYISWFVVHYARNGLQCFCLMARQYTQR